MGDITLKNVRSGYNRQNINRNFETIEDSINNDILHNKDGNNTMFQDIDANDNTIFNLRNATAGGEATPLRQVQQLIASIAPEGSEIPFLAVGSDGTSGNTVFDLNSLTGTTVTSVPNIYINGVHQEPTISYSEASGVVTFSESLEDNDSIEFRYVK